MATSASEQLAKIKLRYNKIIPDYIKSNDFKQVAEEARDLLVKNRRLGKTAGYEGDSLKSFGALQDSTIKQRKRYKSNLSEDTTPKKSNATATGQMLDSLRVFVSDTGFILRFIGNRARTISGGSDTKSNAEVARYFSERRPFAFFASSEIKAITRKIRQQLTGLFKN